MIEIYHNPRCSKSRAGLQYLKDKNIEHKIIDYLTDGISDKKIIELSEKINIQVADLVRKHEDLFKKELKNKQLTNEQWAKTIAQNPRLLHRPIVVNNQKAVLAQPPEKIQEIL